MSQNHKKLLTLRETLYTSLSNFLSTEITLESWGDIPYLKITNLMTDEVKDIIEIFPPPSDSFGYLIVVDGDIFRDIPESEISNFLKDL